MNKHIAPTFGKKPSRLSSIALAFIAVTMVPAMAAVLAPGDFSALARGVRFRTPSATPRAYLPIIEIAPRNRRAAEISAE
jgi:hypothetical protein